MLPACFSFFIFFPRSPVWCAACQHRQTILKDYWPPALWPLVGFFVCLFVCLEKIRFNSVRYGFVALYPFPPLRKAACWLPLTECVSREGFAWRASLLVWVWACRWIEFREARGGAPVALCICHSRIFSCMILYVLALSCSVGETLTRNWSALTTFALMECMWM